MFFGEVDGCVLDAVAAKTSSGVVQAARASSRANHEKSHTTSSSRLGRADQLLACPSSLLALSLSALPHLSLYCPPSVVSVSDAVQRFSPLDPDSLPPTQTASPQTSPLRSAPVPRRQHHSSHQSGLPVGLSIRYVACVEGEGHRRWRAQTTGRVAAVVGHVPSRPIMWPACA